MGAAAAVLWFDFDVLTFQYKPRFSVRQSLVNNATNNVFYLYDLDGSVTQYNGATGAFAKHTDPGGNTVSVVSYLANAYNFTEVQRSTTVAGVTTVESFLYDYVDPTAALPPLASVTLRRKVGSGAWTNVTNVLYTYYADGDAFGAGGDLQTVTTQTWVNNAWVTTGVTLYRYWLTIGSSSSSSGSSCSTVAMRCFSCN